MLKNIAKCIRLNVLCLYLVVNIVNSVQSTCPLNTDQDWLAGLNMKHEIFIDDQNVICIDNRSCDLQDYDLITNVAQLKPLSISVHDVIVPVYNHSITNTSIFLQQVPDEEYFLSCNYTTSSTFKLENITNIRINRSGQFYFIVSQPENWCDSGLRFIVNVRNEDCMMKDQQEFCSEKGNCVANIHDDTFTCKCCSEYIGRYCQERDGCYSSPCQNNGLCVDITEGLNGTTFQCLCPFGFKGVNCEEHFNPCDSQPCLNNGTCLTKGSSYECLCPQNYSGSSCQNEPDFCASQPCVHGMCRNVHHSYQCFCYPGFGGKNCDFEYDECDSNPCMNGGICEDAVAGYSCHCPPSFRGNHCQIHDDLCFSNPCSRYQICVSKGDHYTCNCPIGFTGEKCDIQIDPCEPNPCLNGGSCWLKYGSFFCACSSDYIGQKCEEKKELNEIVGYVIGQNQNDNKDYLPEYQGDLCASDPCSKNQICVSRGDHYTCSCPDGFTGDDCETRYDPCEPNPCMNGGSCWLKYGSFYCACKPGFTGQNCEERKQLQEIIGDIVEKDVRIEGGDSNDLLTSDQVKMSDIHNIYIATGTLLAAVVVVLAVVTISHCIYKKPYQRFPKTSLSRVSSSTALFAKGKKKKILSSKDSTVDSIYDRKSREYCVETLDIPLISSMKYDERI